MYPLVVSFFTDDWGYPRHAERLRAECDRLGLDHRIERRESRGGYLQNSCIKPEFIRECLQAGRPVLWIDVDGSIFAKPDWFLDTNWDFQARKMDKKTRKREWHVGTLWFNPTPQTLEFVDAWVDRTGDMTDESALDQVWKSRDWNLRTRDIPADYFVILRDGRPRPPKCVIGHRLSKGESKAQQMPEAMRYEREVG